MDQWPTQYETDGWFLEDQHDQYAEEDDTTDSRSVDLSIIAERTRDLKQIERDTTDLSEIMLHISAMLMDQAKPLQLSERHVEQAEVNTSQAVENLEMAADWKSKARGTLIDAGIVITGAGLGTLGFLATPMVGVPTVIAGLTTAISLVVARRKMAEK